MSSGLGGIKENLGYDDPKEIELVEKIGEKTRQGKISWAGSSSSLVATAPGMQISFVRSLPLLEPDDAPGGRRWEIFSVRDQQGREIMKANRPSIESFARLHPYGEPRHATLLEAVDALYSAANGQRQGDIDKALNVIKSL